MTWNTQPDPINSISGSGELDLSAGTVIATGSTAARTLADRFAVVYNVKDYEAVGDGVADDGAALEATLDAAEGTGGIVYVPQGTYAYATSPNFARVGVSIYCEPGTIFTHTGTGHAFILDGGATGSGILGNRYENITVQGNANSTNGIYIRSIHHCIFEQMRCKGCATTGSGILTEWCVLCEWRTPTVSVNEGALSPIPLHGMKFDRRASDGASTAACLISNPIMEGLTNTGGAGLYFDRYAFMTVQGGASESNYNGLVTVGNATEQPNLNVIGTDFEDNANLDLDLNDNYCQFLNVNGNGASVVGGGAIRFIGGALDELTINDGLSHVVLDMLQVVTTLTDNNATQNTIYRGAILPGGAVRTDTYARTVAAGSLPSAGASMNGTILIEDGGAGDRNLIVYAGGQRFRIDGGAAF